MSQEAMTGTKTVLQCSNLKMQVRRRSQVDSNAEVCPETTLHSLLQQMWTLTVTCLCWTKSLRPLHTWNSKNARLSFSNAPWTPGLTQLSIPWLEPHSITLARALWWLKIRSPKTTAKQKIQSVPHLRSAQGSTSLESASGWVFARRHPWSDPNEPHMLMKTTRLWRARDRARIRRRTCSSRTSLVRQAIN